MNSFLNNFFGWPTLILVLIPIVILVRIFVKTSRWSILKMVCIALSGTLLLSSWLFYASLITGNNLGGEWGRVVAQRMAENMGDLDHYCFYYKSCPDGTSGRSFLIIWEQRSL